MGADNRARAYENRAAFFGNGHALDASPPPANDNASDEIRWIHCCNEGLYRGHGQGEFDLTRETFDAFVANLRAEPQFRQGSVEVGGAAYSGGCAPVVQFDYEHASEMHPAEGEIPTKGAPACGWVLDLEVRTGADGKAQLWALAQLGEQVRGQIARKEYRWVSIAFTLQGVHWISGDPIGPVLTSIAFTNHPFMRDLEPLAAANRGGSSARPPAKVKPPLDSSEAPGASKPLHQTGEPMSEEFRARVCKALGIRTLQDDAAVAEAVEEAATGAGDLRGLLEALGVQGAEEAMRAIPELRSARERLASVLGELDALISQDTAIDQEMAAQDVGAAMSAQRYTGDGAKRALAAYREQIVREESAKALTAARSEARSKGQPEPDAPSVSQLRAARAAARKRFLADYGIDDPAKVKLTQPLVAGPGGAQVTSEPLEDRDGPATRIDLRGVPGVNTTARLIAYFKQKDPAFAKLPIERQLHQCAVTRSTAELQV